MVRVSGPDVQRIGAAVLDPFRWMPGSAYLATLRTSADGSAVDRVIVTAYGAPRSFTGEDVLELATHGGQLVPALALSTLLAAGARQATAGEFTRRAVSNGKMDLLQAEAVADLVDARSAAMLRAALHQLDGALTRRIAALRERVIALEALLAYEIDFPEEDDGPLARDTVARHAAELLGALDALAATSHAGEIMRDGALVVLAGPPNSGKSSLFNALIGRTRAIVAEVPGTTRDALEAVLDIHGWTVRLVDTAGLREGSPDPVEQLGIEVAERYVGHADLVLVCVESAAGLRAAASDVAALTAAPRLLVRTKSDLVAISDESDLDIVPNGDLSRPIAASAVSGAGIGAVADAIARLFAVRHPEVDGAEALLTRERHRWAVARAGEEVRAFLGAWGAGGLPATVAAVHLRAAGAALEELIGVVDREDVLDQLFRSFCIGK